MLNLKYWVLVTLLNVSLSKVISGGATSNVIVGTNEVEPEKKGNYIARFVESNTFFDLDLEDRSLEIPFFHIESFPSVPAIEDLFRCARKFGGYGPESQLKILCGIDISENPKALQYMFMPDEIGNRVCDFTVYQ